MFFVFVLAFEDKGRKIIFPSFRDYYKEQTPWNREEEPGLGERQRWEGGVQEVLGPGLDGRCGC